MRRATPFKFDTKPGLRGGPFLPTIEGEPIGPKVSEHREYPRDVKERLENEAAPGPVDGNPFIGQIKKVAKRKTKSAKPASMGKVAAMIEHAIHISKAQQRKLVKGERIRIPHKHLGFVEGFQTVPIRLNALQMHRFERAHAANRGLDFQLQSQRQQQMHGKGWFGDLFRGVRNAGRKAIEFVKPAVTEHLLPAIQKHVIPRATNYASDLLTNRIAPALERRAEQAIGRLANRVESGVDKGLDLVDQGVSRVGLGIGRGRGKKRGRGYSTMGGAMKGCGKAKRKRGMTGDGFFDDVWSGIKSVGSTVGRTALPIATNLLVNRAMGPLKALTGGKVAGAGVRGRRMRHGRMATTRTGGSFIVTGARG